MTTATPIFADLIDEYPEVLDALVRDPWNYHRALKAADEAIAKSKRPAKKAAKRAPRKAGS